MIYVIGPEESTIVKIGHTTGQPSFRLGNLQVGNPEQLVVRWACEGGLPLEGHLHAVFKPYRLRGEWFDLAPLGEPVEAVQAEVQAAAERMERGEPLLQAGRHHSNSPRPNLKAFDKTPQDGTWDPEVSPQMRKGGAVFMPTARPSQTWAERFPSPHRDLVTATVDEVEEPPSFDPQEFFLSMLKRDFAPQTWFTVWDVEERCGFTHTSARSSLESLAQIGLVRGDPVRQPDWRTQRYRLPG